MEEIWGTGVCLDVRDNADAAVADEVFGWFRRVDALFSTWRDDSEIVRIARGELATDRASPETRAVLDRCAELQVATGGAFDVAATSLVPAPHGPGWSPLDPSALVKGWALDRAAALLGDAGVTRFSINAGGDVVVGLGVAPGEPWRVGIVHPWEHHRLAAVVAVENAGVATSGRYERGGHIVDPRSGSPATGLASVTVVAPDLGTADAYSTAVFALGRDGLDWLRAHSEVDAMVVTDDARVFTTVGFDHLRDQAASRPGLTPISSRGDRAGGVRPRRWRRWRPVAPRSDR